MPGLTCDDRSGLTIPLQISLSDIRLSAFIILVFSRQKGLTLVFRNDPLESLKVSSTFDSIPFVRDYLQKEIEGQLRNLFMEELPAIIHRLSLRLWVPEHAARDDEAAVAKSNEAASEQQPIDPLASSPEPDANEFLDFTLDPSEPLSSPSYVHQPDTPSLFSQKNLVRLAALNNSHRTLALFTPSIRDAVFRAWAGASERGEAPGAATPATPQAPSLSRSHSYTGGSGSTYVFSSAAHPRPSLTSFNSAMSGLGLSSTRHARAHAGRKRKSRVVNLRRTASSDDAVHRADDAISNSDILSDSIATSDSATLVSDSVIEEEELVTPPTSPKTKQGGGSSSSRDVARSGLRPVTPPRTIEPATGVDQATQTSPERINKASPSRTTPLRSSPGMKIQASQAYPIEKGKEKQESSVPLTTSFPLSLPLSSSKSPLPHAAPRATDDNWGLLERAWMVKLAQEIAATGGDGGGGGARRHGGARFSRAENGIDEEGPPPAYEVR